MCTIASQNYLSVHNPFCQIYKTIREWHRQRNNVNDFEAILKAETSKQRRQYHLPAAGEVAVILPEFQDNTQYDYRNVVIQGRNDQLTFINELHWYYDPLQYIQY